MAFLYIIKRVFNSKERMALYINISNIIVYDNNRKLFRNKIRERDTWELLGIRIKIK